MADMIAEGEWWLPKSPSKRSRGTLRAKADARPELVIEGTFGRKRGDLEESEPLILGSNDAGEQFTLEGCFANLLDSFDAKGHRSRVEIRPLRVYKGLARGDIYREHVTSATFELDFFADWIRSPAVVRPGNLPAPIVASWPSGAQLTISYVTAGPHPKLPDREKVSVLLRVSWPSPQELRAADQAVHRLCFLFALGMARAAEIRHLSYSRTDGSTIRDVMTDDDVKCDDWLRLKCDDGGFEFSELQPVLPKALEAWEFFGQGAHHVMDIVVSDLFDRRSRMPAPFLALATGLEGYHRWDIENTGRRGPKQVKGTPADSNETWTFRHRVKDMFDALASDIGSEYPLGRDMAIRVGDVRDYYAHYLRNFKGATYRPKSHEEIQVLCRFARVLLLGHILRNLSFPGARLTALATQWASVRTYTLPGYSP